MNFINSIHRKLGKKTHSGRTINRIGSCSTRLIPILNAHAFLAGQLPLHHKDPFDRMLVAQAHIESMGIISNDGKLHQYDVDVFW